MAHERTGTQVRLLVLVALLEEHKVGLFALEQSVDVRHAVDAEQSRAHGVRVRLAGQQRVETLLEVDARQNVVRDELERVDKGRQWHAARSARGCVK